jgi:hypothetical protein
MLGRLPETASGIWAAESTEPIDGFFSGLAQAAVQEAIRRDFFNELPVGSAVVVRPSPKKPVPIYAPTMRVPGNVGTTINAYLAMRAILIAPRKKGLRVWLAPLSGLASAGLHPMMLPTRCFKHIASSFLESSRQWYIVFKLHT